MVTSTTNRTPTKRVKTPTTRTQAERRQEAEDKLLFAARKLVAKKGWVGMTLSEVGEEAGYSRGLAAHHFGNKSGLLRALANFLNDSFHKEVSSGPQRHPGMETLRGFILTYFGRTDPSWTNTRALLLLMAEATIDSSETGDILANYNQVVLSFLEHHVQAGIDQGELRPELSAQACAAIIMGALRGVMLQKLVKHSRVELKAVSDQLIDLLERSLLNPVKGRGTTRGASRAATRRKD